RRGHGDEPAAARAGRHPRVRDRADRARRTRADRRGPARARPRRRGVPPVRGATMAAVTVRVLVVDDDALVRAALVMMLDGAQYIAVVVEAADGAEVPAALDRHPVDVVLMDL